jgi:hypothetical protein
MERYETIFDKRKYAILYSIDSEEIKKIIDNQECILDIEYIPNQDDLFKWEQFQTIYNEKESEFFRFLKSCLLTSNFYKEIDFVKVNRSIGISMTSGSIYIDDMRFGYYIPKLRTSK